MKKELKKCSSCYFAIEESHGEENGMLSAWVNVAYLMPHGSHMDISFTDNNDILNFENNNVEKSEKDVFQCISNYVADLLNVSRSLQEKIKIIVEIS